ncbi:regulator of chromosome condensation 1/beta-lactamase-inhibitor protein II [Pelagophyceae sp. CCMP2097]|nr:regulator of chromosome condensation 1/beta-lactamase-inhibitor protein II [Pelagophyceae sp. CCMP2097]
MSHSTGLVVDKRDQAHAFGKYHWALGRDATGADNVVANGGDYGTPRPVSALSGVRIARVAVGFNSAFAASETELWAWGMNRRGQLATGDRDHRAAPTKVGFPFDGKRIITCLAADDCRAVVVLSGKAYTWGESFAAGRPDVLQPAEVGWPSIEDGAVGAAGLLEAPRPPLVAAYLGCYFAVALDASGSVFWWGEKSLGLEGLEATLRKIPSLRKVVHASVGFKHCLAMTLSGEVYAFGRNTCNQVVALPNTEDMIHSPLKVLGLDQVEVATVYAGGGTSFVVSKCGQVRAWGYGGDGALATGLRHEIRRVGPTVVDSLLGKHVTSLSGSSGFVAVAKDRFGVESYITWGRTAVVVAEKESSRIVLEPHTFALSGLAEKHANAFEAPTLALAAPAPETRAPTPAEPRAPTPSAYVGGALLRFAGPAATALRSGARMLRPCGCKVADCTDQ